MSAKGPLDPQLRSKSCAAANRRDVPATDLPKSRPTPKTIHGRDRSCRTIRGLRGFGNIQVSEDVLDDRMMLQVTAFPRLLSARKVLQWKASKNLRSTP
jgi:hypothetical protein